MQSHTKEDNSLAISFDWTRAGINVVLIQDLVSFGQMKRSIFSHFINVTTFNLTKSAEYEMYIHCVTPIFCDMEMIEIVTGLHLLSKIMYAMSTPH